MNINIYKDVTVVPVFNQQAPMIWENFVELEMSAMSEHGYAYMGNAFDEMYDKYSHIYTHCPDNMAFVAYYNGEIVGFTSAYRSDTDDIYLNSLFVKHGMQGMGIGKKLIRAMEQSAALIGSDINGICYNWSKGFYKKMGYKIARDKMDSEVFTKKLDIPHDAVIPVFNKWRSSNLRPRFSVKGVDGELLRKNVNQPIFVHVNKDRKIDVVGFTPKIGPDVFWADPNIQSDIINCRRNSIISQLNKVR